MNRLLLTAAALTAAATLAGCYESNALLLDVAAARQPITSYDDWNYTTSDTTNNAHLTYHARLNPRSDGWYDYEKATIEDDGTEGEWEHYTVLLNYLENAGGMDVYVSANWDDADGAYVYGLVAFWPNGTWQSIFPNCDIMGAEEQWLTFDTNAAQSAGAQLQSDEWSDICSFTTADSLFAAMRTIVRDPGFRQRVEDAAK